MASFNIKNNSWNTMVPEFEIEGFWGCDIVDGVNVSSYGNANSIRVSDYFPNGIDIYISNITFPQLNLDYENNEFGLISFKEKSPYDEVTINFYDDLNSSCKSFFMDWLHSVYDETKQALNLNWRYEAKDMFVSYYRPMYNSVSNSTDIKITSSYKIVKCLPKGISEISTDEESGSRKSYSVVLACQAVKDTLNKMRNTTYSDTEYYLN